MNALVLGIGAASLAVGGLGAGRAWQLGVRIPGALVPEIEKMLVSRSVERAGKLLQSDPTLQLLLPLFEARADAEACTAARDALLAVLRSTQSYLSRLRRTGLLVLAALGFALAVASLQTAPDAWAVLVAALAVQLAFIALHGVALAALFSLDEAADTALGLFAILRAPADGED